MTAKDLELAFKRFNTKICDLLEMNLRDERPCSFEKGKKFFLQESNDLKTKFYELLGLEWQDGRRYRMSRNQARNAGYDVDSPDGDHEEA